MNARNWLIIRTHDGQMLTVVNDVIMAELVRTQNEEGWFQVTVSPDFDPRYFHADNIVEFWRQPVGGEEVCLGTGLMRIWGWKETGSGEEVAYFSGPDQIELLKRRIVNYRSQTSEAEKAMEADDLIKEVVNENMGPGAGNDYYGRPRYYPAAHFSIAPDETAAPSVDMAFAWRNVLEVIKSVAEASANQGTNLFFDLEYLGEAVYLFKTWVNIRGVDRTLKGSVAPIVFSKETGNLAKPDLKWDYSEEINYVTGGGPGEGAGRIIDPENDQVREQLTIWNKREAFQDARECPSTGGSLCVANKAFDRMQAGRPKVYFTGKLLDTPSGRFAKDWFFGDKVTIRYHGFEFDGHVAQFHLRWTARGDDTLEAAVKVTETLEGHPT